MAKQFKIQFADDNYANGGVTYSEWSKDDFWQEQFQEWMEDGNVIKFEDGYSTQDAQYRNRLKNMSDLKRYFYKEFIKGQQDSYADGGSTDDKHLVAKAIEYITGYAVDTDSIVEKDLRYNFKYKNRNVSSSLNSKLVHDTIRMNKKSLASRYAESSATKYNEGGGVKVDELTKQDFINAYLKRVDSVIENLKQKGQYDSEDFDLLGEVDKKGGFTESEEIGWWLNYSDGNIPLALAELMAITDYIDKGWDDYRKKSLEKLFFGKNIDVKFELITAGDFELGLVEELEKIKLLSKKVDFDEVRGIINYEEAMDNTNLTFYKNGEIVMSLAGIYTENDELETIIEVGDNKIELNYHPFASLGGLDLKQLKENIDVAFKDLNTYSAVVSIEGYEEYAEDVEGLENAKALIQNIKGNTRFQVLKGSSVGIGKRVDDSRVVEEFAKGGKANTDIYDYDEKMALINLGQVYEYAIKLDKMIKDDTDLEEWVKMKLTRIEQNISDVKHSLEGWEKYKKGGEIPKKQLLHIAKYSKDLIEMIQGGSRLMSWQEDKLAVSSDSIDNIYHHLDYQMGNRAEDLDVDNEYAKGGEAGFDDAGTSMVMYHEKKGNFIVPKGQVYLWLYDVEDSGEKINSEEYDYVMYPFTSRSMAWQSGYIPPLKKIWTKKFQKTHKGSEHLLGVIKAYLIEKEGKKELYIDMMSVNPTKKKKGIMSYMIKDLRDTFKLTQDQVTFSDLTPEGEKFIDKKTYADGGGVGMTKSIGLLYNKTRSESEDSGDVVYLGNSKNINLDGYTNLKPYSVKASDDEIKIGFSIPNQQTMVYFSNETTKKNIDRTSFEKYNGIIYISEPLTEKIATDILKKVDFFKTYAEGGGVNDLENYINIDKMNPMQYEIVKNFNTLKSLAKNGFIELHEKTGLRYKNYEDKAKSQVKGYVTNVRHDYIKSATSPKFEFNNRNFAIGYIKGLNFEELYVLEDMSNK